MAASRETPFSPPSDTPIDPSIPQLAVALYVSSLGSHTRSLEPMNGSTSGHDDRSARRRLAAVAQHESDAPALESIVVRYEGRPDRCTIAPRECSEADQLTTWISANVRAFVDLADVR
jgi:hypothetical protein